MVEKKDIVSAFTRLYSLDQELADYGPQVKSEPQRVFVNKVLLNTATPICLHIVCSCYCPTVAGFSNCNSDCMASKARHVC